MSTQPRTTRPRAPSTPFGLASATAWQAPLRRVLAGLAVTVATLGGPQTAAAIEPTETNAETIMAAVEARETGDKMVARLQMTITDSADRSRSRVVQTRSMKVPGGTKQIMLFESPADVRNTGLLSMDWDEGSKDDDQWLYLPSLHKSTRIASTDKSGAFMGSDLTYADMTKKDPKNYSYTLSKPSAPVGGEDCWLIEARPKTDKEKRETGYLKSMVWVSKTRLLPLQSKIWVIEGKKIKLIKSDRIEKIDGIWVPRKTAVRTMRGDTVESQTVLEMLSIKLNDPSVKASDFEQRRLEQGL